MEDFTHLDEQNNPQMVDVSAKKVTLRRAVARTIVQLDDLILEHLAGNDNNSKKGPVFQTAILAGIMAAKKTGELIPLCHPIGMDSCDIKITLNAENDVEIICEASLYAKTGVEMEALTGASVAALTIYDMCKGLSHKIIIKETRLIEKTGGKRDFKLEI